MSHISIAEIQWSITSLLSDQVSSKNCLLKVTTTLLAVTFFTEMKTISTVTILEILENIVNSGVLLQLITYLVTIIVSLI